ncbi:hypothetical protein F5Y05DRAFT_28051 [Hypoxylon sp. FL0543]|nr:hypothetical protein F5Y05DRAFT_28051 [Hypoxylon sp. FL0543]
MADIYRRSGRGGAGNFFSQKDIEAAATKKAAGSQDLEAQNPQHTPADDDEPPTDPADVPAQTTARQIASAASSGGYARTGRGGAGNFVDPASIPSSAAEATATAPPSSNPANNGPSPHQQLPVATAPRSGLSGRGGAGNWEESKGEGEAFYDPAQEHKRREALDAGILQDIRESLPPPPRIHYMHGPGRGRKPETLPTS